ncbi:hypothetical protein DPMN_120336 [Dreissena polymorpha]|uniref:Uncharacterized protein n=1 Tax=Dreissena polymorpha TaxID=45954 RepID=A0A9D4JQ23_DREPO|nr:hypothetical protein DPMN_120336 [Dreissena polymorpha]
MDIVSLSLPYNADEVSSVVYAVNFRRCRRYVYVGDTGGTLYQRHLLTLSRIRTQHSDPVAEHFYTDGHSMDDFQIMGLEKLSGSGEYRKTMEQLWNTKLRRPVRFRSITRQLINRIA